MCNICGLLSRAALKFVRCSTWVLVTDCVTFLLSAKHASVSCLTSGVIYVSIEWLMYHMLRIRVVIILYMILILFMSYINCHCDENVVCWSDK